MMMNVIWIVIHVSLILIIREIGEQKFWSDTREQKHDFLISFFEGTSFPPLRECLTDRMEQIHK